MKNSSQITANDLHRSGNITEALAIYRSIIEEQPTNADVIGMIAIALYQLGDPNAARAYWRKGLSLQPAPHIILRDLNNYLAAALQNEMPEDIAFLAAVPVPDWQPSRMLGRQESNIILSLARALLKVRRAPDAIRLLENAAPNAGGDPIFLRNAAEILVDANEPARAELLLRVALINHHSPDLLIAHAAAAYASKNFVLATELTAQSILALPVLLMEPHPNQKLLIGVLNPAPQIIRQFTSPKAFHFAGNSTANIAQKSNDSYRLMSIFPTAPNVRIELAKYPRPDIIFNNWVNAEVLSTPGTLEFISSFTDSLALPVINHPRVAVQTTRQRNAERLQGIQNLVVPRIVRFVNTRSARANLIHNIRNSFEFPLIIRDPFAQMGRRATLIKDPKQLEDHLNSLPDQQLYAIEYVHNPTENGIHRKIRVAVIGGEIIMSHVLFSHQWSVHRERDKALMEKLDLAPATASFAEKISSDLTALGQPAFSALHEIADRIPLDYFGIDFDILPDGRALFFEANASMNIGLATRRGTEDKRSKLQAAFRRLLAKRLTNEKGPKSGPL